MNYKTFEELEAWKLARELKNEIRELVKKFPAEERFRLTDQLIRCSRSVGANISEGFGRYHFKENSRFCFNARGSLMEILHHLTEALDEGYINQEEFQLYKTKILHCNKVLNGYIAYLKKAATK